MNVVRTKGRPKRQSGDAGRDRLVAAAQVLLRKKARIEINSKELAKEAGVTPALVRYYFQNRSSLIEAVAQPIIDDYLYKLKMLLRAEASVSTRFELLIGFFLEVNRRNGWLIDSYVSYAKQTDGTSRSFLASSYLELDAFMKECEDEKFLRVKNSAIAQTVIWGACKTVAQMPELNGMVTADPSDEAEVQSRQVALLFDMLVSGLQHNDTGQPRRCLTAS